MKARRLIAAVGMTLSVVLSACGAGTTSQGSSTDSSLTSTANATVNLVVTDTPPTNIDVLSFQVEITGAVLEPGDISLLRKPVTVDLVQLAADTSFLASQVIGSATYTSLTLTFADPMVTYMNNSTVTTNPRGQSCAPGAVCTFAPLLNQASVTISSGVFPLTVTANSTTGLNLDLSIPDLLQSDLSVTLANGKSVNLSLLGVPASSSAELVKVDDVLGTITQISGSQVNITTAFADQLVLTEGSSTQYKYPASICSSNTASCLAVGQIVTADLSLAGSGALSINSLSYAGGTGGPVVKGTVLSVDNTVAVPTMQLLVQRQLNASAVTPGEVATVSLPAGTVYAVGTVVYPGVSGGTFTSSRDLLVGQEVVIDVGSEITGGSAPSFSAAALYLESSQVIGRATAVDSATSQVTINGLPGFYSATRPFVQQMELQTDSTTTYAGFATSSFSGLAAGQYLVAKGPLFNTTSSGAPTLSAIQMRARTLGN